ncbi:MAG TPA: MoaD/ThiS family protein [Niabella sp.]|nr:MoaD/ThiS family protein [Niabella sp.]HQW14252.1 MoaD/ThiS family protein [Niabella sp.]HQX19652.1 MoaD/ThiS family protein [Niabella sp.]HQX39914.1 MoaD/ThiS family protein [Niabella sp.]HRB06907.1 MoaD/ThiS family protein [Niabella sp.]
MNLKSFGRIRDIVPQEVAIAFPISVKTFREKLEADFSVLAAMEYRIAVNEEIISDEDFVIEENAVIALLPPFSGG